MALIRWVGRNFGTLLISFILAAIVWASAVTSADPNEERIYEIPIEIIGQDTDIEIMSEIQDEFQMTLYAPSSILEEISKETNLLRAWVDLSGLGRGKHNLTINYIVPADYRPLRLVEINPKSVEITLEELGAKSLPIQAFTLGEPALGYQRGPIEWSDQEVLVSGRVSDIDKVVTVEALLDITGANGDINTTIPLLAMDSDGNPVPEVSLTPDLINVMQMVTLQGGYRNMVVKVVTSGQVAEGYRQTNVTVSPPNVMVFSSDLAMIEQLPGYIETETLDISGAVADLETILALNLPDNVSIIGDPNVRIQVGVAAIEGSISISRKVEVISIMPGFTAIVSPDTVEMITFGPIPTLQALTEVDIRVVVDLTSLEEGVYQLKPEAIILPDNIEVQVISPDTLEVEITAADPETLTATPVPTP
jgi:YbbR domain-containing protein